MMDWPQTVTELTSQLRNLRGGAPEVMKAFSTIAQAALAPKVLDSKTKELIALSIAITRECDGCIAAHGRNLARLGATTEEVAEMIGVSITMNGGPGLVWGPRALEAFLEHVPPTPAPDGTA